MEESSTIKTYLIGKNDPNKRLSIDGKRKQEYFAQINIDHDLKKPKTTELFLYSDFGNSNLHQLANVASEADPLHVCLYDQNYPSFESIESIESSPNHSADTSFNYDLQLEAQNSGTVFLQLENCYDTATFLPYCRECHKNRKTSKYSCRFYMFRKVLEINNQLSVWGFSERHLDPTKEDIDLWKRSKKDEIPKLDKESVDYLLSCIASKFCEMSQEESETETIADAIEKNQIEKTNMYHEDRFMSWKRSVLGIREMCDVCETSLFNLHWTCRCCGLYVCIDCFVERKKCIIKLKSDSKIERDQRDSYFWYKCTDLTNPIHSTKEMMLTQIITCDSLQFLTENLHKLCEQWQITQKCGCSLKTSSCLKRESKNNQLMKSSNLLFDMNSSPKGKFRSQLRRLSLSESKSLYSKVKHTWSCHGRLLKILEVNETEDCYKIFQDQWEQGKPVIISNITDKMNKSLWKPKYFSERFGRKQNHLINCKTGVTIKKMPMRHFWEGFEKIEKRLPLGKSEKYVLKLKDWPTSEDFAELIQEHFDDLMNALPLKDYTHRNGKYNLASFLPKHFVRPDLGPKMYSAYSQTQPIRKGSTNLHLDVSDAVNVMVYVSKPVDSFLAETQYSDHVIRAAIRESGTNDDIQDLPGAIWHIFPASGADCIRQLLTTVAKENGKPLGRNDDPIHDQSFYLDAELRKRLRKEYKIEGYTIIQYEGDAVFIPAGAPHQVVNLLDCVKIAEDFVSPENIEQCFLLTQQFRALSNRHSNHEDKLQIKNILYHTVKTIVSEFGSIVSNDSNDL